MIMWLLRKWVNVTILKMQLHAAVPETQLGVMRGQEPDGIHIIGGHTPPQPVCSMADYAA